MVAEANNVEMVAVVGMVVVGAEMVTTAAGYVVVSAAAVSSAVAVTVVALADVAAAPAAVQAPTVPG